MFLNFVIPSFSRLQLAGRFQGHKAKKSLRSQLPPDAELVLEAADEKVGRAGSTFHGMTCYTTNQIHFKYTTHENLDCKVQSIRSIY